MNGFAPSSRARAADFLLADRPAFEEFISVDSVRRLVAERRARKPVSGDATLRPPRAQSGSRPLFRVRFLIRASVSRRPREVSRPLRYSVVTPARNEATNLRPAGRQHGRADDAAAQWLIVDNGSLDATGETAGEIARELPFTENDPSAGARVDRDSRRTDCRAFDAGVRALDSDVDIIVKLGADVSFGRTSSSESCRRSRPTRRLGIAGSTCYEQDTAGEWRPTFATATTWRDAPRTEARVLRGGDPRAAHGWDGIDELKAQVASWHTRTLPTVPFRHHRALGAREGRGRSGSVKETWRTSWGTASATSSSGPGYGA